MVEAPIPAHPDYSSPILTQVRSQLVQCYLRILKDKKASLLMQVGHSRNQTANIVSQVKAFGAGTLRKVFQALLIW